VSPAFTTVSLRTSAGDLQRGQSGFTMRQGPAPSITAVATPRNRNVVIIDGIDGTYCRRAPHYPSSGPRCQRPVDGVKTNAAPHAGQS
jgi:hypothetical protein